MPSRDLSRARILVVDDEQANIDLLEAFLAEAGYARVSSTRDPRRVRELFETLTPDLVLLDLHMPHLSGFEVMRELAAATPPDDYLPILVLTADITAEARQRALAEGAKDFLSKPLDEVEVLLRIRNLLETRFLYLDQRWARARAEAAQARAAFLAEASRILASSFDTQATLARLARLAVPDLADFCMVELADGDGGFTRAGLAHVDPARQALIQELAPAPPLGLRAESTVEVSGEPSGLLLEEVPEGLLARREEDRGGLWSLVRPSSLVIAPLLSGSTRPAGFLTLATAQPGRRYGPEDLDLAQELARRTALAVEKAELFHAAQQATRARDDILAVVAHDLRNPLNTINMVATMLLAEPADASQRKYMEVVSRSAQRMNEQIQDLLEVTRLESGKLTMELRPAAVRPLLAEAAAMLRPLAGASGIEMEVSVADGMPPVLMDNARILQVLSNLVGNAIKFTAEGGSIRVCAESSGSDVRFTVADTGRGIPPEQLPHIFGRFWQASATDRRGIGLGLSIARGIVEAHGGTIWVESTPGRGSTFFFTLPRAAAPAPRAEAAAPLA